MNKHYYIEAKVRAWLIRYMEGVITGEELESLREWMEHSDEHLDIFNDFRKKWLECSSLYLYDTDRAWTDLSSKLEKRRKKSRLNIVFKIASCAAAVILILFAGNWFMRLPVTDKSLNETETIVPGSKKAILILGSNKQLELDSKDNCLINHPAIRNNNSTLLYEETNGSSQGQEFNQLITPRGGEYSLVLSDGTKVRLNAETELKYPVRFDGKERVVYLKGGEAYFSVAKKDGMPFVVYSGDSKVTVLGTEFNIRNYQDEHLATTLVKGAVVVTDKRNNQYHLKPGQQAVLKDGGIEVNEVETVLYTAWKDGFFIYREKTLDHILNELSRWYDFVYFYEDKNLAQSVLTAKLKKFDTVDQIFEILAKTGKFRFTCKSKTVIVGAK